MVLRRRVTCPPTAFCSVHSRCDVAGTDTGSSVYFRCSVVSGADVGCATLSFDNETRAGNALTALHKCVRRVCLKTIGIRTEPYNDAPEISCNQTRRSLVQTRNRQTMNSALY